MAGAIVLTFVVTALIATIIYLMVDNEDLRRENHRQFCENAELRRKLSKYSRAELRRREDTAYDRGLYDGRTTDAYYRQCLKKFTNREQAEVMMNGEPDSEEEKEA